MGGVAAVLGGHAADDGAEQDGDEGRALHQRVAGGKLRAGEMVGKDAVLDGAEQRGDDAEEKQREEQQQHRMQAEAHDGDDRDADLGKFEPLRHLGLVVAVGKFAAERRQKKVGRDEDRGGERNQRLRVRAADMEQKQKDQRGLEDEPAVGDRLEDRGPGAGGIGADLAEAVEGAERDVGCGMWDVGC